MHSKNFERIKRYYDRGEWTKEQVLNVVGKPYGITEDEYWEIVGLQED